MEKKYYKSRRGLFKITNEYCVEFENGPIEPNCKACEKPINDINPIIWQIVL